MHVDLEVQVAANRDRVAGLPHRADALTGIDALALVDQGGSRQVGVEIASVLAFAVDQQVVAVEDRVIAGPQHLAVADGDQPRVAGGNDVEALVGATAAAGGAELANRAAGTAPALDGEDVSVEGGGAIAIEDLRGGAGDRKREEERRWSGEALQWCSMTRSTSLYSLASSALMK
jgi:hypothetical protein